MVHLFPGLMGFHLKDTEHTRSQTQGDPCTDILALSLNDPLLFGFRRTNSNCLCLLVLFSAAQPSEVAVVSLVPFFAGIC